MLWWNEKFARIYHIFVRSNELQLPCFSSGTFCILGLFVPIISFFSGKDDKTLVKMYVFQYVEIYCRQRAKHEYKSAVVVFVEKESHAYQELYQKEGKF